MADPVDGLSGGNLKLDLSRGKPGVEQISLSDGLDGVLDGNFIAEDGTDTRNYGGVRGVAEARGLGSELLGVPAENIIAAGNSSLSVMHLVLRTATDLGLWSDERTWSRSDENTGSGTRIRPALRFVRALRRRANTHCNDGTRP